MIRLLLALLFNQFTIGFRRSLVGSAPPRHVGAQHIDEGAASPVVEVATPTAPSTSVLTTREVAKLLGVSHDTVIKYFDYGALPGRIVNTCLDRKRRTIRFSRSDVDAFLARGCEIAKPAMSSASAAGVRRPTTLNVRAELNATEAAKLIGVSTQTVIRLYDAGRIVGRDVSASTARKRRCIRFSPADVDAFLSRRHA